MTDSRAYSIISDISEGGELSELGIVAPYDDDEAREAARHFLAHGLNLTSPGRMGRAAHAILEEE